MTTYLALSPEQADLLARLLAEHDTNTRSCLSFAELLGTPTEQEDVLWQAFGALRDQLAEPRSFDQHAYEAFLADTEEERAEGDDPTELVRDWCHGLAETLESCLC